MDVQRLIGEVAKRHGVLVDPSDPIFVAVTLNELLLAEYIQKVQAAVEQGQQSAAAATSQQLENAKRAASHVVTGGATYVSDQVRAVGAALRIQLEHLVHESMLSIQAVTAEAARHRRSSQWAALVAGAGASLFVGMALALCLRGH